jgi:hypothetical protein
MSGNGYALEVAKAQEVASKIHPTSHGYMGWGALTLARHEVRVLMRPDKGSGWSMSRGVPLTTLVRHTRSCLG